MHRVPAEPTQIERAEKLNAKMVELLNLDPLVMDRGDHIDTAREMLGVYTNGMALAIEVLGENANELEFNNLTTIMLNTIDRHLAIAEAKRPTKAEGTY